MRYEIKGTPMPVAICYLSAGESILTENGAMSWMTPNLTMTTTSNGGIGKMFSRAFQGEAMFQNIYTAQGGDGMIAMASSFPGEIMAVDVAQMPIVAQKHAFLASEMSVNMEMFFQSKIFSGLAGGEGFIMQKFSGHGIVFLEIDGTIVDYQLAAGQSMMVDQGMLAAMEASCSIDVERVKGAKNMFLGGEGFFNTRITGPGHIWLQTMPSIKMAQALTTYRAK